VEGKIGECEVFGRWNGRASLGII